MKVVTSRDFNQDVSEAKRLARSEPVIVTDRGRPTHVLMSFETYARMNGKAQTMVDLLAEPEGTDPFDFGDPLGAWDRR